MQPIPRSRLRPVQGFCGLCHNNVSRQLAKSYRASDGEVPKWGQEGAFTIPVGSVPVRIEVEHLCGLGMFGENLMPHFSIHIVEKHRLFLSHRVSLFLPNTLQYRTRHDHGRRHRAHPLSYVQGEMKGKLEKYDPYKGYSPKHRRDRMIADGIFAEHAAPGAKPAEEAEAVEDDDSVCDGCDAPLTMLDEYTKSECGTFCGRCFVAHTRDCDGCESDIIEDHGGVHPCPTRSGGALLPEHEALRVFTSGQIDNDEIECESSRYPADEVSAPPQLCLF